MKALLEPSRNPELANETFAVFLSLELKMPLGKLRREMDSPEFETYKAYFRAMEKVRGILAARARQERKAFAD